MNARPSSTSTSVHVAIALTCLVLSAHADCTLAGSGTTDAPYTVGIYADLEQVGTSCGLGSSYRLTADIDASPSKLLPRGFVPIGHGSVTKSSYTLFSGGFHGAGHVIRNLFIDDSTDEAVGLFGYVTGATIDSLGLVGAEISGTVMGSAPSTITGRPSLGNGDTVRCQAVVGGIAGITDAGTSIQVVFATGSATGSPAGGIVGTNGGLTKNVYAACRVSSHGYAGGIAGKNEGTIAESYASKAVSGGDTVVVGSASYGGGIAGVNTGAVENSYWNLPATGQDLAFGADFTVDTAPTGLTAAQSVDSSNFKGFGFGRDSAWSILQGQAAPVLRLFASVSGAIRSRPSASARILLRRTDALTEIVLPFPALVRVVDASGRQVLASTEFASGAHGLDLPPSRSMLFVQVRSGNSTTTLPLEPMR